MQFTPQLAQKIGETLRAKGAPKECPMCGTRKWTMAGGFVYMSTQDQLPNIIVGSTTGMPCVAIVCDNCGNTQLFNLIQLGLKEVMTP